MKKTRMDTTNIDVDIIDNALTPQQSSAQNDIEAALLHIWKTVLRNDDITKDDNFFESGGNSLLALQLISFVRSELKKELSFKKLFQFPAVSQLASQFANEPDSISSDLTGEGSRPAVVPLSYNQKSLWFIDKMEGSIQYHIPLVFRTNSPLKIEALEFAWRTIVNRHEILRTVIIENNGEPYQLIKTVDQWALNMVDIPTGDELEADVQVKKLITEPFDLSKDHMLKVHYVAQGASGALLVVNVHHIAGDGWSTANLIKEFKELYNGYVSNKQAFLPPVKVQYADYALWQNKTFATSLFAKKLLYWKERLAGIEPLNLPTDHLRSTVRSVRGARKCFEINEELFAQLTTLKRKEGVTTFMLLLSAFKILLYRYSSQADICVGSAISNRTRKEMDNLIGFFVNTVVLRSNLSGNPTYQSFLHHVKQVVIDAFEHQDVPFEMIVREVAGERDSSRNPLFDVLFSLENFPQTTDVAIADGELILKEIESETTLFDLNFTLWEKASTIVVHVEYCTDLFSAATIERMINHYLQLLNSIVQNPGVAINELRMLVPREEHQLLVEFNGKKVSFPRNTSMIELFEQQVSKTPDSIAVYNESRVITYRELNARANQLGFYLKKQGVGKNEFVGIYIERGIDLVTAIFGVLKSGAAFIPIDIDYPEQRVKHILQDSRAKFIIIGNQAKDRINTCESYSIININAQWSEISSAPDVKIEMPRADDLIYAVYTSGSTGLPKGAGAYQKGVVNLACWYIRELQLSAKDQNIVISSIGFDLTLKNIFATLISGGALVLPDMKYYDRDHILDTIRKFAVTIINCSSSPFYPLVEDEKFYGHLETLRFAVIGGEPLKHKKLTKWMNHQKHKCVIINSYGPSECSDLASFYTIQYPDPYFNTTVPIGRPLDNVLVYVLNEYDKLQPIGVHGELCVAGDSIGSGYLFNQQLTEQKFRPNPFGEGKMYQTGDLVRWLPDGNIDFIGRIDTQVKIRGQRIELSEIDTLIQSYAYVSQATSKVYTNGDDNILVAYVITEEGYQEADLRKYLQTSLPAYMIPQIIMQVTEFPLTFSGKIDAKALPPPALVSTSSENTGPSSSLERSLLSIWSSLLRLNHIEIDESFFSIGGHSLLVIQLMVMIEKKLGIKLSVKDIFDHPTIRQLAAIISTQGEVSDDHIDERSEIVTLSHSQERVWFIHQLEGSVAYHIPISIRITGHLNEKALQYAFTTLIERHVVLRTVIHDVEGMPMAQLLHANEWSLNIFDLSDPGGDLESTIAQLLHKPFDLASDFMIRANVLRESQTDCIVFVVIHHIACDGLSIPIIAKEVSELYNSYGSDSQPHSPLALQYYHYAQWQRKKSTTAVFRQQLDYWRTKLADVPVLDLPTDYQRTPTLSNESATVFFNIDRQLLTKIETIAKRLDATNFMVLVALFKAFLFRYTGQAEFCVGTPVANRMKAEFEGLVGFFVNTLVIKADIKPTFGLNDLLADVKRTIIDAYNYLDVPFEKIVEVVAPERDLSRSAIFQVMIVHQQSQLGDGLWQLNGAQAKPHPIEYDITKFDLTLTIEESASGLRCGFSCRKSLFRPATIARMAQHFYQVVVAACSDPLTPVGKLDLLTHYERLTYLDQKQYVPGKRSGETVIDWLEAQAQNVPEAIALILQQEKITYRELSEKINKLARYLRSKGVARDTLVPICIDNSIEMIIGVFAIMRAGGAYVPIDPSFPTERINYILSDISAPIIITGKKDNGSQHAQNIFSGIENVDIIAHWDTVRNFDQDISLPEIESQSAAYSIYTSGTTGRPKGVVVQHDNLTDYLIGLEQRVNIQACRSFALASIISADASNTALYSALISGGTLHLFSAASLKDPEYMHQYFSDYDIQFLKMVPSYWKAMSMDKPLLPSKMIMFGGERLPADTVNEINRYGSSLIILNHYGPTETTVGKMLHVVDRQKYYDMHVPIGKPFSNTVFYIVSEDLQLQPIGVPGELLIGGDGVARGYHNNDELTNKKFITNPFAADPPRLYRTGDVVRLQSNGNVEYIGRSDDQIKISGNRIEIGEIENVILRYQHVKQAVVVATKKDNMGIQVLIAYVTTSAGYVRQDLELYLKQHLAEYMLPRMIVELETIPLAVTGKVNKLALPDVSFSQHEQEHTAPRNNVELAIASIWRKLLNVDRIGIYDDFFRSGGHSLLAIRLTSLLRSQLKLQVNVLDLFKNPTIAGLAARTDTKNLLNNIEIRPRPERIPLSYSQEGLWIIDRFSGSGSYHVFRQFTIKGILNVDALNFALKNLVTRHESLRAVYYEIDGTPYQKIMDPDQWVMDTVTDAALTDLDMRRQYVARLVATPFDLSTDYMFRATLIHVQQDLALLVLNAHHIAVDGWSFGIITRELLGLYQAYQQAKQMLPPVHVQYADFALWQREYATSAVFHEKMQYWRLRLKDPTWLDLPVDMVTTSMTGEGSTFNFTIDLQRALVLKALAREEGVTPYVLFIAVFNILLHRYAQQNDILIGTTASNRLQDDVANTVGYFVNSLVIRTHIDDQLPFTDYLRHVKQNVLNDLAHQDMPFDQIVSHVLTTRNVSHSNPLFRVMLDFINMQEIEQAQLKLPALVISESCIENRTTKFDLTLSVLEKENAFDAFIEYRVDMFLPETIKRMSAHLLQLLDSVIANHGSKVGALKMITAHEHDQIINGFNNTARAFPSHVTVVQLFKEQCLNRPSSIALVHRNEAITFQELDRLSDAFAFKLLEKGVKPQTNVPVLANRGIDFIAAVVGIWKVGAVYIPFDPEYPAQRIEYMIGNSGVAFIIADVKGISTLPPGQYTIIDIGEVKSFNPPSPLDVAGPLPTDLAYVIYTSGSTGNPKGVMIEHMGMLNHIFACINELGLSSASVLAQNSSQSFDVSVWQMFTGLVTGAKTIIFDNAQVLQIDNFLTALSEHRISVLEVVPSYLRLMLEHLEDQITKKLDDLQYLIATGESVSAELVERWFKRFPAIKVVNAYGPAEASDDITFHIMDQFSGEANIPIGKPLPNINVYVIDHFSNLCPIGIKGQICVSGIAVGRGYLNNDKRTAEAFTYDYVRGDKSSRLYHTGDIGRFNADGTISFFGRDDHQTKIRGHRIEFGEVESVLEASELVRQAVVTKHKDRDELIAYVVSANGFSEEQIRSHLKTKLPAYMIPAFIIHLSEMPLNPNGKINRLALPPPPGTGRKTPKHALAENDLEEKLVEIWEAILNTEVPAITDDFFALGGNSLHVIRLLAAIRKQFNIEISVTQFFNDPTIAALSRLIGSGSSLGMAEIASNGSALQKVPLSFSQERLWFLDKLEGSRQYHIKMAYHLRGNLDTRILEACLKEIVCRHEALRTIMVEKKGTVYQHILPWENWNVTSICNAHTSNLEEYLHDLALEPFDLSTDYLIRAYLIDVNVNSHILLIVMHHIASDGWSCNVLQNELERLYNGKREGVASPLAPLPVQYRNYAVWQHTTFHAATALKLQYWKMKLADVTPLLLPTDFKRPAERTVTGATVHFDIDQHTTAQLRAVSKQERVTLFMTLTAVFKILLFRHSNQTDIAIGTPVANRSHESIENLIGFFVNTIVLRSSIDPGQTFLSYLAEIRKVSLEAYEHQDVPFEKIVASLVGDRSLNMNPLFQVMFILHNQVNGSNNDLNLNGLSCSQIHFKESTAKFDLNLSVIESASSLHGVIEYSTDLFAAARIERLAKHFQQLLQAVVHNPSQKVSQLKMLTDDEEVTVLTVFNRPLIGHTEKSFRSVIEMFSAQAAIRPDAVAVLSADAHITYRELESLSNQLARYLKQLNIGKGSSIPVCMERNIEMIVVLLGVMKTGAAYVPIDSAYPRERIVHMIREINASYAVIHQSQESLFEGSDISLFKVQDLAQQVATYSPEPLKVDISYDQLAYIIFTSGSTGKPKGILTEHGNISSYTKWCHENYDKGSFEVVHSVSSISFDFTTMDIYYTLSVGKTIRVLDSAFTLGDYIHRDRSIMINCVPSVLLSLIRDKQGFGNISIVNMSGESIPKEVSEVLHANPHIAARNLYGPTEATVISTSYHLNKENLNVIGRPISIARIYIVDPFGNLCPIGVSGEIWIGGLGVARGYVQANDKFISDPFSPEPRSRVFKTGDQGRWLEDGNLELLGRFDDQVKIRGYRIELGEIENVLKRGKWIKECIVQVKTLNDQKYIVAYVVPVGMPEQYDIYAHLKESLPDYMMPSTIIYLDKFTLSPNGKVDRRALPAPDFTNIFRHAHVAPRNSTESHVAEIWKRLLRLDSISMIDNFYRLGGHSLMVVELLNNLRTLSSNLKLKHLLKYQTIEEQARLILDLKNSHDPNPEWFKFISPLSTGEGQHPVFLIPGARGTSEPYYEFAEALTGISVYGINLPGLWDNEEPLTSMKEIASFVIGCIRSVQPRGPYCIIGHSFGGHVLFEIIKQLEASNEPVGLAAMIDIPPVIEIESDPVEFVMRITGNILHFGKVFSKVYPEWFNIRNELAKLRSTEEMFDALRHVVRTNLPDDSSAVDLYMAIAKMEVRNVMMMKKPEGPLNTALTIIKAAEGEYAAQPDGLGWHEYAPLRTICLPGNHNTIIFGQNAKTMADFIKSEIEKNLL